MSRKEEGECQRSGSKRDDSTILRSSVAASDYGMHSHQESANTCAGQSSAEIAVVYPERN